MLKIARVAAETFVSWSVMTSVAWELVGFLYKHGWLALH